MIVYFGWVERLVVCVRVFRVGGEVVVLCRSCKYERISGGVGTGGLSLIL